MSSSTGSFDTTLSCRPMDSRLGACVVIHAGVNDDEDTWVDLTLSPEDVDRFIIDLKQAKADAVARYGRKDGEPRKSPLI